MRVRVLVAVWLVVLQFSPSSLLPLLLAPSQESHASPIPNHNLASACRNTLAQRTTTLGSEDSEMQFMHFSLNSTPSPENAQLARSHDAAVKTSAGVAPSTAALAGPRRADWSRQRSPCTCERCRLSLAGDLACSVFIAWGNKIQQ